MDIKSKNIEKRRVMSTEQRVHLSKNIYLLYNFYMNIKFEFDPNKSKANKEKHGIDFIEAEKLWEDKSLLIVPAKNVKGESRFALIGKLNGKCWICIFTLRNNVYRIISVRRCSKKEEGLYEKKSKKNNR